LAVNSAIGAALQNYFPYPFAYRNNDGTAVALTSAATGMVLWSASGSAPYNESDFSVTVDPESGTLSFPRPTSLVYGGGVVTPPSNVMVFVPVATGDLQSWYPSSSTYGGTLYTVEGIHRTKTITLRDWTEYGANANIATFAYEQFTSFCDVVIEGTISYLGLAAHYLAPGQAISITGQGYTTGYESVALPVASAEVLFQPGAAGTSYITICHLSNRRQRYTGEVYVRPEARGQEFSGANIDWGTAFSRQLPDYLTAEEQLQTEQNQLVEPILIEQPQEQPQKPPELFQVPNALMPDKPEGHLV